MYLKKYSGNAPKCELTENENLVIKKQKQQKEGGSKVDQVIYGIVNDVIAAVFPALCCFLAFF